MYELPLSRATGSQWPWLTHQPELAGHCFYIIFDSDSALYVGRSQAPLKRLQQHLGILGRRPSRVGQSIMENLPASLRWTITLLTPDDCISLVPQQGNQTRSPAHIEQALIDFYRPRFNRNMAVHYPREHPGN